MQESHDGVVIVGEKSLFKYVAAAVEQYKFSKGNTVKILARGKNIAKAVDVAMILKRDYMSNTANVSTKIDSTEYVSSDGKNLRASTIEILIK